MGREDHIEVEGTVKEVLQGGMFRVSLDNGHEVLAYTSGKCANISSESCLATKSALRSPLTT